MTKIHDIDASNAGETIRMGVGDLLNVSLKEASSGGYLWDISIPDLFTVQSNSVHVVNNDIGGANMRVFSLEAKFKGTVEIKGVRKRPWEQAAIEEISFKVVVD